MLSQIDSQRLEQVLFTEGSKCPVLVGSSCALENDGVIIYVFE